MSREKYEKNPEIPVILKTYEFLVWACKHISHFPRQHRFVLGERLERSLYQLLETLLRAKYESAKVPPLREANMLLEILRFQIRLAKDLQCAHGSK